MRTEYKTKAINAYELQIQRKIMTVKEIAHFYGVATTTLQRWAKRHNVILARVTDFEIAEGIWDKTPKELAAEYNVSLKTVYRRLARMGICTKQDGQK